MSERSEFEIFIPAELIPAYRELGFANRRYNSARLTTDPGEGIIISTEQIPEDTIYQILNGKIVGKITNIRLKDEDNIPGQGPRQE